MSTTQTSRGHNLHGTQDGPAPAQTPRPTNGSPVAKSNTSGEGKTSPETKDRSTSNVLTSPDSTLPAATTASTTPTGGPSSQEHTSRPTIVGAEAMGSPSAGFSSSAAAIDDAQPHTSAAAADQTTREGHSGRDTHSPAALAGSDLPADQKSAEAHDADVGGDQIREGSASEEAPPSLTLADPFLALAADIVDDLERTRIANENRLRMLTRAEVDEDGEMRGLGMDERDPNVARTAALVDMLAKAEHQAVLNLNKLLREHPLGPWIKAQKGVGEKTAARLLAVVGDPYVNLQTGEVRTVSQLWAYCGHGDPSRRKFKGMSQDDLFRLGNPTAKKRVWLIATAILKAGGGEEKAICAESDDQSSSAPLAAVYYARKHATEGREHVAECVRCGPSGKPALPGSPWSDAHRHADALRIVGKEFLRQLWLEAKRLHEST